MGGIRKVLTGLVGAAALALCALPSWAGSCIDGGCHATQIGNKHLHGPLAAEQVMGNGCNQCHLPDGKECSSSSAGAYKLMTPKETMCTSCHEAGESPEHVGREAECLECHSPHGSDSNPFMLR